MGVFNREHGEKASGFRLEFIRLRRTGMKEKGKTGFLAPMNQRLEMTG